MVRFKSFDNLRLFTVVAHHLSFTAAAHELHLTKGAVSYQIARLENELGFVVFTRHTRGIALTEKGGKLLATCRSAFDDIEYEIATQRYQDSKTITIGMTTYFASRWLSPRLMNFTSSNPQVRLRLQPTVGVVEVQSERIDMLIRWGIGDWNDLYIESLFKCPVMSTAGRDIATQVQSDGLISVLRDSTLLHDFDGSSAWADWHKAAGLRYRSKRDDLVIPDPNVRVQAVIDGQGIALNDRLVEPEITSGKLFNLSTVTLDNYGYFLAYPDGAMNNMALKAFRDWLLLESGAQNTGQPPDWTRISV